MIVGATSELHRLTKTIHVLVGCGSQGTPLELATVLGSLVDDWHVLQVVDVRALDDKDGAADLEDISDAQGMERALLALGAQSKPGAIGRAYICEVEPLPLLLVRPGWSNRGLVANLCVVVAHLRVFLDTECVLLVTTNGQATLINRYHSVPCRALKHVQFNHRGL